ncbi:hypothetical protein KA001_03575 [Patescibacteria group bacterium]|nr:hypothetical protein [Patescibacteria group bacterium]
MEDFIENKEPHKHLYCLPLDSDKPWDTISVIAKLVEAADILLHQKDYDGHGWEEIQVCYERGKEIVDQFYKNSNNDN